MSANFQSQTPALNGIYSGLFTAAENIYAHLKKGSGLHIVETSNDSGDAQIGLDVIADEAFFDSLKDDPNVRYVVSEERPGLSKISDGDYSIALDPLDGSKSALIGIPSGAIFGIFKSAETDVDFHGGNIVSGGFFVFGMNLEVYFADGDKVFKGLFDQATSQWTILPITAPLPISNVWSINGANMTVWDDWLQDHYAALSDATNGQTPINIRWFASMVSDIKRLVLQGGMFAYPRANRKGYEKGHLRLVYEAIPMSFLIHAMGGASSNGQQSLLKTPVKTLHEKTPVFIGEADKIAALHKAQE
ncbi:hypothetical protein [Fretibacter rubidus]|uniref:hypothetical protein n=1 Tax=Fretibacter rubidus TaxID=570162 RepID=UPI00352AA779